MTEVVIIGAGFTGLSMAYDLSAAGFSVTIIENSQDVIDLVWEHCAKDDTFTLITADIETWEIPEDSHWDYGWFDTWLVDNPMNMKQYKELMYEKYGDYVTTLGNWESIAWQP